MHCNHTPLHFHSNPIIQVRQKMKRKKPQREFTYKAFRNKYGKMTFRQRNFLIRAGMIQIFQQGYRGHSLWHSKKIRVRGFKRLNRYVEYLELKRVKQPWLETVPEFADYEEVELYFRKEPKPKRQELKERETMQQEIKTLMPKPISRPEFRKIAKTIRGDYPVLY